MLGLVLAVIVLGMVVAAMIGARVDLDLHLDANVDGDGLALDTAHVHVLVMPMPTRVMRGRPRGGRCGCQRRQDGHEDGRGDHGARRM